MKKLLAIFMFTTVLALGFASSVQAEDEIILYPYDKIECLQALDTCTNTKVGDSHWDVIYNGYLYNVVGGNVRYASEFDDEDFDGFVQADEMTTNSWSSFGGLIINNTASEVILDTQNARADLTGAVHRIYSYWDENGNLMMFEDHYVTKYYIFNDGTVADPDWRLATQAEADAYDAADPKPDDTMYTTIRIAVDDVDTDGYVIEPITSLAWHAQGVDTGTQPESEWSSIIDGDPNQVVIPAGWTVFGFGTLDRDGSNSKTIDFIKTLVGTIGDDTITPATVVYEDQPATFAGIVGLDDDAVTPGVNIVVDYGFPFETPEGITASWVNMFDDTTGDIINETEMLDYSVVVSQDGTDLETINYTYDGTDYTADGDITVIDENDFGAGYVATYIVTTPEGDTTEYPVDIVVGVMPPTFAGIEDRYVNEDVMVDLGMGITADDGYGNDKTDDIIITYPDGFNPYYPQPGTYQIDLEFNHNVVFEAPDSTVTINGTTTVWDNSYYNSVTALSDSSQYAIWTDAQMVHDVTWGYGRVLVLVGADGLVDAVYDRYTWDVTDSTGEWNDGGASFETWKAGVVIEPGGFVIGSYGSTLSGPLRALAYDDPVSFDNTELDTVTINGATLEWDRDQFNSVAALNVDATQQYAIFTNATLAQDVGWAWGSVMVLVGADGLVDAVYDRYTWDIDDETGAWVGDATVFADWKAALAIEAGGFVIASHGSIISPPLRALTYDDPVSYAFGEMDMEFDILTQDSYMLTVDDLTAPVALVVDDGYTIETGEFATANAAILANVVAFDNYDAPDDLAVYVSNNGGLLPDTAGTYTVEVTVEDVAGNSAMVTFDVEIVAAPVMYTAAEVDAMIADAIADQDLFTATEAQALIDAAIADQDLFTQEEADQLIEDAINAQDLFTEAEAQELVDQAIEDFAADAGCGSALSIGTVLVMITGVLGAGVLFFIRKH